MEKINVRGVFFDNVTMEEAVARCLDFIGEDGAHAVYTPNSEIVQMCLEDPAFRETVNSAELIIPDGIGVVKAAKILGTPLKGKVAGVELGEHMLRVAARFGYPVYFLGGKPGVAETAAQNMEAKYPGLNICAARDGYFKKEGEESDRVVADINRAAPLILFVCLGVPAQEKWLAANKDKLKTARVCLALGGSLDVFAGNARRAPKLFINLGLEWFYRLLKEPWRIGRMSRLPRFLFGTYREKWASRRNQKKK